MIEKGPKVTKSTLSLREARKPLGLDFINVASFNQRFQEQAPEKKLIVFIGDSASGKTTLITELEKRHASSFKKIVTCTSRLPRTGEINGIDYYFLPPEYFIDNQDLVLVGKSSEGNYYGTRKSDLFSNDHHLLLPSRPSGVKALIGLGFKNLIVVRLTIDKETKKSRMRLRGDTEEEINERLQSDQKDMTKSDFDSRGVEVIEIDSNSQALEQELKEIIKRFVP